MELKETKGLKGNMHSEIDTLERKAFDAGYALAKRELNAEDTCSWEKGVHDAWEFIYKRFCEIRWGTETFLRERDDFINMLEDLDPTSYVREFVEERNRERGGSQSLKVGDVVKDAMGNKCTVTNTDTHIHVVYENGKTHKWDKTAKFTKLGKSLAGKVIGVGKVQTISDLEEFLRARP